MIPKRIFYVWFGSKKSNFEHLCLENWRMMLPDYHIIEINENTPELFDFNFEYQNNLWFKTTYDLELWAYVSDYVRLKVLYQFGGIYLDTDITVYKDFTPLLNHMMFVGNMKNNLPELAVIGVVKEHPIIKDLLMFYDNNIWIEPEYITCNIFRKIITEKYNISLNSKEIINNDLITIYPYEYFYPFHLEDFDKNKIKSCTYTVHWENASWSTKKNLFFLNNKHKLPLTVLLKQLDFIDKYDKKANEKIKILK